MTAFLELSGPLVMAIEQLKGIYKIEQCQNVTLAYNIKQPFLVALYEPQNHISLEQIQVLFTHCPTRQSAGGIEKFGTGLTCHVDH